MSALCAHPAAWPFTHFFWAGHHSPLNENTWSWSEAQKEAKDTGQIKALEGLCLGQTYAFTVFIKQRGAAHLWLESQNVGIGIPWENHFHLPYQPKHRPWCSSFRPWLLSSFLLGTAQEDGWCEGPLLQPSCCGSWCSQPT